MSFGFETDKDEWDKSDEKNIVRTLKEVTLHDVSVVTFPAYPQTTVAVRSDKDVYEQYKAQEREEQTKLDKRNQEIARLEKIKELTQA